MKKVWLHHSPAGILIVEAVLSIALFVMFASGAIYFLTAALLTSQTVRDHATANSYVQEGVEAVQTIDRVAWNQLADDPTDTYGLALVDSVWTLVSEPDHPHGDTNYTRTVTISDVYRDSVFDPHTRQVTVTVVDDTNDKTEASVDLTDWDAVDLTDDTIADWADGSFDNVRVSSLDDGELQIIQPTMEVGSLTATNSWQTVTLANAYDQAVVVTSILDGNNPEAPVSTRVRAVTSNSFDVRLQFPTDNFAPSSSNAETVNYMVVEAGTWTLGDGNTKLEAGIVEDVARVNCSTCGSWNNGTDISYQHSYTSAPVVLHQVVTEHDTSWITSFVSDDTNATVSPGTDGFQVALNGAEVTASHAAEDIGYIVWQGDTTDDFERVKFETDLTGNAVRGYSNPRYTDNFDHTYTAAPLVLAAQLSARSPEGSWLMLDTITASAVTLYLDEDQTLDSERAHVTEYAGYVTFATAGTYYLHNAAPAYAEPMMEVGVITNTATGHMEIGSTTANTSWSTVTLSHTYTEPVVVATVQDGNNPDTPLTARVRNAAGNSFQVRLDIPLDKFPPATSNSETVNYMVVEAGVWTVGDGRTKIEADIVENVSRVNCWTCGSWNRGTDITYRNAYSAPPVVLHQIVSEHSPAWITSFVSDDTSATAPPGTDGFQVALNGAEATSSHGPEDIGYIVMANDTTDNAGGISFETDGTGDVVRGFTDAHTTESFTNSYSTPPIVVSSQAGMDSTEGSWAMLDSVTSTQLTVYVDEDQRLDAERSHITEDYFYVAFSAAGSLELRDQTFLQNPVTVTLQNSYVNPVVVTTPHFTNDLRSPASVRVYDVSADQFTAKLDAPPDNFPPVNITFSDDVYYLVMEAGTWQIGDMKVEAHVDTIATVGSRNNDWVGTSKTFDHSYDSIPIVLHQVMSNHDDRWITSWVSRSGDRTNPPSATALYLGLNAAEVASSDAHGPEEVGWMAFEDVGTAELGDTEIRTYRANEFAGGHQNGCYNYTHGGSYSQPTALVTQNSMDSTEGSWAAICALTATSVGVHYEEDETLDVERSHVDEAVGIIVFEHSLDTAGLDTAATAGSYESPVIGDDSIWRNFNIIDWTEDVDCTGCDIQVEVRSADAPEAVASASYVDLLTEPSGDLLSLVHLDHPYVQYRVTFSGTTARSPILYDTSIWAYEH